MSTHPTLRTEYQWRTRGISLCWLRGFIPSHETTATSALPTGISRAHSAGENALVVGFVLGVLEDAPLHPESSFAVAPVTIRALLWLEGPQVLKD